MLTANAKGVQTGVNQATGYLTSFFGAVGQFASRTTSVFTGYLGARAFAAAVEGAKDLAKWAAQTAMEYEQAEIAFQVMTGSKPGGTKLLGDIQKLAIESPFKSSELIGEAKLLKAYGVETEDLIKVLSQLGDVASGTGVDISRLSLAYGQVMSKGRFQATELRQFTEAGVGVANFAKAANMSSGQFLNAMEQGKIGSDIVVRAFEQMTSRGGTFFKLMAKQSQTTKGRFDSFIESVEVLVQKLGLAAFKSFDVAAFFNRLAKTVQNFKTTEIGEWMGRASEGLSPLAAGMESLVAGAKEWFDYLKYISPEWEEIRISLKEFVDLAIPAVINLTAEIAILTTRLKELFNLVNQLPTAGGYLGELSQFVKDRTGQDIPFDRIVDPFGLRSALDDESTIQNIENTRKIALEKIQKILAGDGWTRGAGGSWGEEAGVNTGEAFAKGFEKALNRLLPGFRGMMDEFQKDITSMQNQPSLEKFQKEMMALNLAQLQFGLGLGGISGDMADKLRVKGFEELKKKFNVGAELRNTAPLLETNSQAAMSALNAVRGMGSDTVEANIKAIRAAEEETARNTKKLADDLKRQPEFNPLRIFGIKVGGG